MCKKKKVISLIQIKIQVIQVFYNKWLSKQKKLKSMDKNFL